MSRRTRVLEVVECGGPGGTGAQVAALCRGLDASRFELHLAYAVRPGSTPEAYAALAAGAAGYHHIPEMVREISPSSDLAAWLKLFRLIRGLSPDIVHAHSSKAGFLARAAAPAAGAGRIYYSPRGYSFQQLDRSTASRRLYRLLERSVSWIGEIIAISEAEAELARSLAGASKVRIVRDAYLGSLDAPAPRERPAGQAPLVCALGRLTAARAPEAFLRLAARLAREGSPARFLWIGDGELRPEFERLRAELGLEGRLELSGWLAQADALRRLREADLLIHYSRWEGLPNAVLDALACGVPVVASDIPGNRELVLPGRTGLLAADEEALAGHARALLDDAGLARRLGRGGRELILEQFTLERMLRQYTELYAGPPTEVL